MTDQLPIPDYDNLPTGSIESRIRTLGQRGVRDLLDHERQHARRVQIISILERRLVALDTGEAEPSGGDPAASAPEAQPGAPGGSKASPVTEGPPQNPPSQGVPTNPGQPRR
jgi:hypothetical protein